MVFVYLMCMWNVAGMGQSAGVDPMHENIAILDQAARIVTHECKCKVKWWFIRTFTRPTIHYSLDEAFYYVTAPGVRPRFWYSVEAFPERFPTGLFDGGVEINTEDGRTYCRKVYDFVFFSIKGGKVVRGSWSDEKVKDYCLCSVPCPPR
jgi:hypothetical protein